MFTIYLDMDGVICNFEKEYETIFGIHPSKEDRNQKESNKNWNKFCEDRHFENLDWWPNGELLLQIIKEMSNSHVINVEILTSTGGSKHHESVKQQKQKWLLQHNIHYKVNCVPGRKYKSEYARKWNVLIDDTLECIDDFNFNGGFGIHHIELDTTIKSLKEYHLKYLNYIGEEIGI